MSTTQDLRDEAEALRKRADLIQARADDRAEAEHGAQLLADADLRISRADLKHMSAEQIVEADDAGRLSALTAKDPK